MGNPGATVAFANLGTGSTQVIAADAGRKSITFSNPNTDGNVSVVVCQAFDLNGNALTAGFSATGGNAGNFVILPGGERTFNTGNFQGAWLAAAKSGTLNNLTMWVVRGT